MENVIFKKLNAINVNDKVEQKSNGSVKLSYLSWAWAWGELVKVYPDAVYEIERFEGKPYFYDENLGYMVFTKLTIENITHEMWLPVMDGSNKAMKKDSYKYTTKYGEKTVEPASMFDINKTIMRCLVKNIAMFGLGLYIYAGEDLPENVSEKPETKIEELPKEERMTDEQEFWLKEHGADFNKMLDYDKKTYKTTYITKKTADKVIDKITKDNKWK